MGTEKLVLEWEKRVKLNEALIERLIEEKTCIIFHVLGSGGSIIPVRVRSDKTLLIDSDGFIEIAGWLPDCPGGEGREVDRCIVRYNPDSQEQIEGDGVNLRLMGTIEINLERVPEFVEPNAKHPVLSA